VSRGSSNSLPRFRSETWSVRSLTQDAGVGVTVQDAGIDTWSPCWYVDEDSPAARAMQALATIPAPRSKLLEDSVLGHRVGWFPGVNLVFAEGHPGGEDALGRADRLAPMLGMLEERLSDIGIPLKSRRTRSKWGGSERPQTADRVAGFAGVRRLDLTCDLRFDSPAEGLAVLAGVAALPLPRMKSDVIRELGGRSIETVYFLGNSGRRLARWYDKGVESGFAPRGQLIRPEDQRRFTAGTRREVEELTGEYVREKFRQRFMPLWQATEGITVGGPRVLATKLHDLVEREVLTPAQAEQLGGYILLDDAGCYHGSRTTRWRRRKTLRESGLVLADGVLEEVEVELHPLMEQLYDSPAWGAEG
jgi:hypothetical protein